MDWHEIAIGLLSILSVSYGWFLSGIVRDQRKLEASLGDLRVELPRDYVSKRDDERRWDQLMETLQRIESKIDGKVDKP